MIRATFLFLILSLFHSSASGQSGWEWQNAQEHPGPSDKFQSRKFGKTQSEQDTLPRFHEGLRRLMAHQKAGELPGVEYGVAVATDVSRNICVTGSGHDDYLTIKYDSSGAEQWVARYDGPANGNAGDAAMGIAVDASGNVYVTGSSPGPTTSYDYATVKYNSSGTQQWVVRYNGPGNYVDQAYAIAVDASENVYVTGVSSSSGTSYDCATVKYNSSGTQQWVARYDGPPGYNDWALAIALDTSGNVHVTGLSYGSGSYSDYATVKYNGSGAEQWVARYNGPGNSYDNATGIALDASGNVYVTGISSSSGISYDYATVKYNSSGTQQWVTRYNGPANQDDVASAIALDVFGSVYVTGTSYGSGTSIDYATVKYDSSGAQQWVARYDGPSGYYDYALAIALDTSGNVHVTGESLGSDPYSDYATVKYDASGTEQWVARYNGPGNQDDAASAIALDASGNVYVTGESYGSGTYEDFATVKYDSSGAEQWIARYDDPVATVVSDSDTPQTIALHQNYPNPFNPATTIRYDIPKGTEVRLTVVNTLGQEVARLVDGFQDAGVHQAIWSAGVNGSGVYFYRLQAGAFTETRKLVLLR